MQRLAGKTALITGGTAGIGAATVRRLAEEGAKVLFTGSNEARAQSLSEETGALFQAHRVQDDKGWEDLAERIEREFGRLDIAFANAGTEKGDASVEKVSLKDWNQILAVNLTGAMLTVQTAVRLMRNNPDGPSGSIVLNGSMNAYVPLGNYVTYSTSKSALIALAKSTAIHCASEGMPIRCNSIHPGVVETDLICNIIDQCPDPAAARAQYEAMAPLRRMASVEEIAGLVAYLASDESAFVTGADYKIDGATTAGMLGV